METEMLLDSAVFQLTPTRTRCELVISGGGVTEKLASGLLKPFLSHLKVAEEQIEKGGYSIVLEVASGDERSWFTKGTIERFVRFVSTPEVLERIITIEIEIVHIEESMSAQCGDVLAATDKPPKFSANGFTEANKLIVDSNAERTIVPYKSRREPVNDTIPTTQGENSKVQLLKVLEHRKKILQKEQGMAYARAAAAGFDNQRMADLVSFAEYFGALRLRKACLNIMEMYKRKQEAGLWLEEMEIATMEDTPLSETSLIGASGIVLNNPIYQFDSPDRCDDPSTENELIRTASMPDNGSWAKAQAPTGISGGNEYLQGNIQQSTMPAWPGQPPQYFHNFQSHMIGAGAPMQGFHGLPMQGIQIGSPYYQSYPGNPYWPQHMEDPRFGPAQRTVSGMSNVSTGSKHYAGGESEIGSPKSVSLSQSLTEQAGHSDLEKESVARHMNSSGRSSHRSGKKRSGMVVIRNINYITSKGHNGVSEESETESESDSEDVIDLSEVIDISEKKHKRGRGSLRKKESRNAAGRWNSNEKDGKHEVSTKTGSGEDDNSSWQAFQTCLLKDNESSENIHKDNKNASRGNDQVSIEPEMGAKVKEHMTTENTDLQMISELQANRPMREIQCTMSKEELLLPQRGNSTSGEEHAAGSAVREDLSILKKPIIDDSIVVSEQHSEMKLSQTVSRWDTGDIVEHTITRNDNHLHMGKHYGQALVDDAFMVTTRSPLEEQANIEWKTQINMDSELPMINKGERSSNDVPTNKSKTSISWEPADLLMMPERNSERGSIGQSWNPAIDNDIQGLVNIADKKYPDADLNGDVGEKGLLQPKQNNGNVKELQEMKSKERQSKAMQETPAKRKANVASRSAKSTKLSPLAEAQLRAEKLRAFKASLQKTKQEKEEEERKRLEQLKLQRQKRIAGRTNPIPSKSTSGSCSSKKQPSKPLTRGKLSISFQKDRTFNNLSSAKSLPRPTTKISNEAIKRLSSHKSKTSNHSSDAPSQSVSSKLVLRKENTDVLRQSTSIVQGKKVVASTMKSNKQVLPTKVGTGGNLKANGTLPVSSKNVTKVSTDQATQLKSNELKISKKGNKEAGNISNVKKNSNQGLTVQKRTEGGKSKTNGIESHSTSHASDNSDSKNKSLVHKRAQPVNASKEDSLKVHSGLNINQQSHPKQDNSNLDNGIESIQSKQNTDVHAIENNIDNSVLQIQESNQPVKLDSHKVSDMKDKVKGSISDDDGFEIIKVSEALSTCDTEVAISGSLDSKQLLSEKNSLHAPSFVIERCNTEEPYQAPIAPVSSCQGSPSESFKFCTSSAPGTPEKAIACEEISTPRMTIFEYNDPHVIASYSPNASPDLQSVTKPPSSISTVADDGKSDSHHSRKRWGNSDNGAKGLRRLLMFGRKTRSSTLTSAE